jgi:osmoprotectant transport system permease protein
VRGLTVLLSLLVPAGAASQERPAAPAGERSGVEAAQDRANTPAAAPDAAGRRGLVRPIVVASKPFAESYVLAEMFAALLEARGFAVDRRLGLGATEIAFGALRTGAIDVYPEYTGTGLLAILGEPPAGDPGTVFGRVSREFDRRFGVRWLPPLGFENTYAIAVRRGTADSLGLRTISDLARAAPRLRAGLTPDFIGREDGLPGLARAYGLRFAEVRPLLQAVKYRALATGAVDVVDGYSTDGLLGRLPLVALEDDRRFFPPYEAAAIVGPALRRGSAAAVAVLTELSGRLDERTMRALNARVELGGEEPAAVAREELARLGLLDGDSGPVADRPPPGGRVGAGEGASGVGAGRRTGADGGSRAAAGEREGLAANLWERRATIAALTGRHLQLVGLALAAAVLVAVPLGLALERARGGAETVIRALGAIQTLPGIALLAFMIPLLGIGVVPALVALFLYSLFPIVRSTYTGVRDASPDAVEAARALGMTPLQTLRSVRLPLAAPLVFAGIRTAAVIAVGTATLAAFIGAGGLGDPIVTGLALSDTRRILSGAIPAALLALAVDGALALVERAVRPGGLR